MDNKRILTWFSLMLLVLTVAEMSFVDLASANFLQPPPPLPRIYLRSDGSIEPANASIQRVGNHYTLTGNITNCTIEIQRDNITLDGSGFNVFLNTTTGDPGDPAIDIDNQTSVTVKDVEVTGYSSGIYVCNSSNIFIQNNNIYQCGSGVWFFNTNDSQIWENEFVNNDFTSIFLGNSTGNLAAGNKIELHKPGILTFGLRLWFSSDNILTGNNITSCSIASIDLGMSFNNTIYLNNFTGHPRSHFFDEYTDPNVREAIPAMTLSTNIWDNGKQGNFWSDYNGSDLNGDGIGDSPYVVKTVCYDLVLDNYSTMDCGIDNYPLMAPADNSNLTQQLPFQLSQISPSINPTPAEALSPSPSIPEFPALIALITILIVPALILPLMVRKRRFISLPSKMVAYNKTALFAFFIFMLISCLAFGAGFSKAITNTITVPDDFQTLQAAVANASPGDSIFVRKGNYAGGLVIDKPISLKGEDPKTTIIVGGATSSELGITLVALKEPFETSLPAIESAATDTATLTFCTKTESSLIQPVNFLPPLTFAIIINSDNVTISNFTIMGGDRAIYSSEGSGLLIQQNILGTCILGGSDNTIKGNSQIGLTIFGRNNLISDNGGGIVLASSNSTIMGNSLGGFALQNAYSNIIINNTLTGSNMGLWIGSSISSGPPTCSYNLFAGNRIINCGLWGILMGAGAYNVFFGNLVANTGVSEGHDGYGLALGGNGQIAENNLFLQNIFENNTKNFGANWPVTGANSFDEGKQGNYWDDYLTRYPNATEVGHSGTGDSPYVLTEGNVDNHPLIVKPDISWNAPTLPESWASLLPNLTLLPSQPTITAEPSSSQYPSDSHPQQTTLPSQSPTPLPSPSVPEFPSLIIISLLVFSATVLATWHIKKASKDKRTQP